MTPGRRWKTASTHQKQPAPRVICLWPSATTGIGAGVLSSSDIALFCVSKNIVPVMDRIARNALVNFFIIMLI